MEFDFKIFSVNYDKKRILFIGRKIKQYYNVLGCMQFFKFKFKDVLYSLRSKFKVDVLDVSLVVMFGNI